MHHILLSTLLWRASLLLHHWRLWASRSASTLSPAVCPRATESLSCLHPTLANTFIPSLPLGEKNLGEAGPLESWVQVLTLTQRFNVSMCICYGGQQTPQPTPQYRQEDEKESQGPSPFRSHTHPIWCCLWGLYHSF